MVQADLNSIHRKDGPDANVQPGKLEKNGIHPKQNGLGVQQQTNGGFVASVHAPKLGGHGGLSASKWANNGISTEPKVDKLSPKIDDQTQLTTQPSGEGEWVKAPPPPKSATVIPPNERWKAGLTRNSPSTGTYRNMTTQLQIDEFL